jgi:hypothetical protein
VRGFYFRFHLSSLVGASSSCVRIRQSHVRIVLYPVEEPVLIARTNCLIRSQILVERRKRVPIVVRRRDSGGPLETARDLQVDDAVCILTRSLEAG